MRLRKISTKTENLLTDPDILKPGVPIDSRVEKLISPKIISRKHLRDAEWNEYDGVTVYKPNGDVLFVYLPEVLDESEWLNAYDLLKGVKGGLDNRPDIIGEKMRKRRIRKSDGKVSNYKATPTSIMKTLRGKSDMHGYFRDNKNDPPGVPNCDIAGWTLRAPDIYKGIRGFIKQVDDVYRSCSCLKEHYAAQKAYVDKVPETWKIMGTNFTTMYVLKDHATAIHWDKFDEKGTFGVMTTLGNPAKPWKGGEIVWPKFRIGCDYRPGDVLLGDVHEYHGNQFLTKASERISCIFFVRKGMHECPAAVSQAPAAAAP